MVVLLVTNSQDWSYEILRNGFIILATAYDCEEVVHYSSSSSI
jgi:hypothetical protein